MNNFSCEARTDKEIFKCPVCSKDFKDKSTLKRHLVIYSDKRPYKCTRCVKCYMYKPLEDLKNICRSHEEPKKSSLYEEALKDSGNLQALSKTHVNKCCSTPSNLDQHHLPEAVHGASMPQTMYKCTECSDVFSDLTVFTQHQETHMKYKCTQCDKAYTHPEVLKQHLRTHINKCTECDSVFDHYETLKEHLQTHTAVKPFKCTHCEEFFKTSASLHQHSWFCVSNRKCAECGKVFSKSSKLSRHLRIHNGEKPYKCTQCDKCFRCSSNLKSHLKQHSGVKPFSCAECDAAFTHKVSLLHHYRSFHGDVPDLPWKCSQCGKGFTTDFRLKRHKCDRINLDVVAVL